MSFCVSGFLGLILWFSSDLPPYGVPQQEANVYWSNMVDIAHKWRTLQLSLWDPGVGGGTSLFLCGQYPLLNPTNLAAWFMDDAHFYLFKMIEPYVFGVFFGALCFLDVFGLRWPYALFGAFYYMGLGFGRFTIIPESPLLLWGCALFPLMVHVYAKLFQKNPLRAAAWVGSLIALQFGVEGTTQFPQVLIWWLVMLTIGVREDVFPNLFRTKEGKRNGPSIIGRWLLYVCVLIFFAIGIYGVQFFPTYDFAFHQSARIPGHYAINNFTLGQLFEIIGLFITQPQGSSLRGILALILMCVALGLSFKKEWGEPRQKKFLGQLWIATILYFVLPSIAAAIVGLIPVYAKVFSVLTKFTFKYAIHTLDFCTAVTLGILLSRERSMVNDPALSLVRRMLGGMLGIAAVLAVTLPVVMTVPFFKTILLDWHPFFEIFIPEKVRTALLVCGISWLILWQLAFRFKNRMIITCFTVLLPFLGFMTTITCYNWNNKGKRTHLAEYHMDSPEYQYYRLANGKYYLPFDPPAMMIDHYNLQYGLLGTSGFFAVPPFRFNKFMASYHNDAYDRQTYWTITQFRINQPSGTLATYFPVDFTTMRHGQPLAWRGFDKKISGEFYDIWERQSPAPKVFFARHLRVLDYSALIRQFDETPFMDTLFIERDDARQFGLNNQSFPVDQSSPAQYEDFFQRQGDRIQVRIKTPRGVFVIVPQMYQNGWKVWIDGQVGNIFPAQYLFLGFRLPPGEHLVRMKYVPPLFVLGFMLSLVSVVLLVYLSWGPGQISWIRKG